MIEEESKQQKGKDKENTPERNRCRFPRVSGK